MKIPMLTGIVVYTFSCTLFGNPAEELYEELVRSIKSQPANVTKIMRLEAQLPSDQPTAGGEVSVLLSQLENRLLHEYSAEGVEQLSQWVSTEAEPVRLFVLKHGGIEPVKLEGYEVFRLWGSESPGEALAAAARAEAYAARNAYRRGALDGWASVDPEAATRYAWTTIKEVGSLRTVMPVLMEQWIARSPEAALEFLKDVPPEYFSNIANSLDMDSLQLFRPYMQENPLGAANAAYDYAQQWSIFRVGTSDMMGDMGDYLAREHPNLYAQWLAELPVSIFRDQAINGALTHFADTDLDHALELASEIQNDRIYQDALQRLAASLASVEPLTALEWLMRTPAHLREEALRKVVWSWADRDPAAASRSLPETALFKEQLDYVGTVASAWAKKDLSAALGWVNSLPLPLRKSAIRDLAIPYAAQDPKAAVMMLNELPVSVYSRYSDVFSSIASRNMEEAVALYGILDDEEKQALAMDGLAQAYLNRHPEKALAWIDALPPGKGRDTAALYVIQKPGEENLSLALEWFVQIKDEVIRKRGRRGITRVIYLMEDKANARQMIETHPGLTAAERSEILRRIK